MSVFGKNPPSELSIDGESVQAALSMTENVPLALTQRGFKVKVIEALLS